MEGTYEEIREKIRIDLKGLEDQYVKLRDDYSLLCEKSLKTLQDMPDELKLNPEEFSFSQTAVETYNKTTKKLISDLDTQYRKDYVKSLLLYGKYFQFFKSRVASEKVTVENDTQNIILSNFRTCLFPASILHIQPDDYPQIVRPKEEIFTEERRKGELNEKQKEERRNLKLKLSATRKELVDHSGDTPVSDLVLKYNKRKEERIKILTEHIAEYDMLENLTVDEKQYNDTVKEIDSSQFKFKDSIGVEKFTSEYTCTFSEKKAKSALFYKKVHEFSGNFNARVCTALDCKAQIDQETDNAPKMIQNMEKLKIVKPNEHIYHTKGKLLQALRDPVKIEWMPSSDYSAALIEEKKRKNLIEIKEEKQISHQKIFSNSMSILMAAKPKVFCEKKFYDMRFNLKCMEINAFKHDLFQEKNCLRIIKELEYKLNKESNELSALEKKMLVLKEKRQLQKNEWINLYNEFRTTIGLKNKHKGYFKQVFKKKIRADDEKEPYKRHSSSESSESEQDIDSEDDSHNVDTNDIDQDLLREVMILRLKRHKIELKLKEFKRSMLAHSDKQPPLQQTIAALENDLEGAWKTLSSIPANRKLEISKLVWPVVLYPENVHEDFIDKHPVSVKDKKMPILTQMSKIYESVVNQLEPIKQIISLSVEKAMDIVLDLELNDLVDIACLFFPIFDAVAEGEDEYRRQLDSQTDSSEILKADTDLKEKKVNVIQEILSAAAKESEEEDNLDAEVKNLGDSEPEKAVKAKMGEADVKGAIATLDAKEKADNLITGEVDTRKGLPLPYAKIANFSQPDANTADLTYKKEVYKSWRDVPDKIISSKDSSKGDIDIESFISGVIPKLKKELFDEEKHSSEKDYYMLPLSLNREYEHKKKIEEMQDVPFKDLQLGELDAYEAVRCVENSVVSEEEKSLKPDSTVRSEFYPRYPGGGLFLTRHVLLCMERDDPESYPYSDFYQEIGDAEDIIEVPKLIHAPSHYKEKIYQPELPVKSFADFVLLEIDEIKESLNAHTEIKKSTSKSARRLRILEKKLSKIKIKRMKLEQELHAVSRERYEEMNNKFSGTVDLDHLQDVKENPLLHIKKFESDTKLNALTNELEELKNSEANILKSLSTLGHEDTLLCYKLLELKNQFKQLNRKYASKLQKFPKSGKKT